MSEESWILADRYEIKGVAGKGGTSIVYKAYDLQAEHAVRAIKEIDKSNESLYEMAKLESKLIKDLYEKDKSNDFFPNIIHRFETDRYFYIVQDYLNGESMLDVLNSGAMPYKMFLESAKQICLFMKFFHSTGRVHSDMKPENIMVIYPSTELSSDSDKSSSVKLKFIDFGTAIRNESGVTGYTPEYASPEQYNEKKLDERTDIFNIGATFFHMIEGRKPLSINVNEHMREESERFKFSKNTSVELKRIIKKCVDYDPEKRYKSCDALYRDLCRTEKHSHIRLIALSFLLTVFCFVGFGISLYQAEHLKERTNINNYSMNVNKGNYAEAIKIDPTNKDDIYSKLIQSFTNDEKISADEHNFIINQIKSQNYITPEQENYGKIMYEIGNAYWLYYYPSDDEKLNDLELEQSRINTSYEWFSKAVSDKHFSETEPDAFKRAVIFSHIGQFYSEIDRKERDGTDDSIFYNSMWENIAGTAEYINDSNEVVSARVCQTLLSLISRYSAKFRQNGISEKEQSAIIDQIEKKVYQNGNITYLNNYSIEIAKNFNIDAVRLKLEMAYAD